jgi:hypothetical protein
VYIRGATPGQPAHWPLAQTLTLILTSYTRLFEKRGRARRVDGLSCVRTQIELDVDVEGRGLYRWKHAHTPEEKAAEDEQAEADLLDEMDQLRAMIALHGREVEEASSLVAEAASTVSNLKAAYDFDQHVGTILASQEVGEEGCEAAMRGADFEADFNKTMAQGVEEAEAVLGEASAARDEAQGRLRVATGALETLQPEAPSVAKNASSEDHETYCSKNGMHTLPAVTGMDQGSKECAVLQLKAGAVTAATLRAGSLTEWVAFVSWIHLHVDGSPLFNMLNIKAACLRERGVDTYWETTLSMPPFHTACILEDIFMSFRPILEPLVKESGYRTTAGQLSWFFGIGSGQGKREVGRFIHTFTKCWHMHAGAMAETASPGCSDDEAVRWIEEKAQEPGQEFTLLMDTLAKLGDLFIGINNDLTEEGTDEEAYELWQASLRMALPLFAFFKHHKYLQMTLDVRRQDMALEEVAPLLFEARKRATFLKGLCDKKARALRDAVQEKFNKAANVGLQQNHPAKLQQMKIASQRVEAHEHHANHFAVASRTSPGVYQYRASSILNGQVLPFCNWFRAKGFFSENPPDFEAAPIVYVKGEAKPGTLEPLSKGLLHMLEDSWTAADVAAEPKRQAFFGYMRQHYVTDEAPTPNISIGTSPPPSPSTPFNPIPGLPSSPLPAPRFPPPPQSDPLTPALPEGPPPCPQCRETEYVWRS